MGHIRKDKIPSVTLSEVDYENYSKKFPSDLKRGLSFSNQVPANIWNANNLEAENTDLKIKNAALESENTNLKIENAALESALVDHKLSHKELESQIQESKNRFQVLETEKVNLKLSHKELEAQIQEAKNKIQDLEIQIQESKNKVQDLEAKRLELQKIYTDLTLKYSFIQKDLVKLQHEKVENEEEIKTLKVEINEIIAARNQIESNLLLTINELRKEK
ncbi:hypothetical protein C2G38_2149891 [Gigaspora rosea]|uniref:Uncharacterized protein n=1 Tax=Gigaspora rosea TaxID=44941 RepID=A0A397TX97_9GLOM|nr:hypothetical protein C2G38_2149891 [Gigaspora rosea]